MGEPIALKTFAVDTDAAIGWTSRDERRRRRF
jgi:hypothetical protein